MYTLHRSHLRLSAANEASEHNALRSAPQYPTLLEASSSTRAEEGRSHHLQKRGVGVMWAGDCEGEDKVWAEGTGGRQSRIRLHGPCADSCCTMDNLLVSVDAQDGFPGLEPREREQELAVEATRAAEGTVEGIRAVGGTDYNHLGWRRLVG